MKQFRFRLDALLGVRRFELRRRVALLAQTRQQHAAATARAEDLVRERDRAQERAARAVASGIAAGEAQTSEAGIETSRRAACRAGEQVIATARDVERERCATRSAHARVEALERLRGRRRARWLADQARAEQRALDEIGTRGFVRERAR